MILNQQLLGFFSRLFISFQAAINYFYGAIIIRLLKKYFLALLFNHLAATDFILVDNLTWYQVKRDQAKQHFFQVLSFSLRKILFSADLLITQQMMKVLDGRQRD